MMDVRVALRGIVNRPGFAAVAVLTLGIGIGANTAMFSLLEAVVLTPLPFPAPERLVQVWETAERDELELRSLSFPLLEDLERERGVFEAVAGIHRTSVNLAGDDGEAERVVAEMISPAYFSLLGMKPLAGRLFDEADDRADMTIAPVVLSDTLWTRRYGGDPSVVGRRILLNEVACTVVGVAVGGGLSGTAALWTPLQGAPLVEAELGRARFERRGSRWLDAVGRLGSSVTLDKAHAFMERETARLRQDFPDVMESRGVLVVPLEEGLLGDIQRTASSLMIAAVLVLLITCANLAGLLLARGVAREREIALRLAVGAGRARIARQLLTESVVLSLLGGCLGAMLALFAEGLLSGVVVWDTLPSYVSVRLGTEGIFFASAVTLLTAFLSGAGPSLVVSRASLAGAMRGRAISRRSRARSALVVVQVAVALALTIGSVLVLRSFSRALAIEPGFSAESAYTLRVELPAGRYDGDGVIAFARQLEGRLEAIPGLDRVALASDVPLVDGYSALNLRVEERLRRDPEDAVRAYYHRVSPGFFASLGIPLLHGRDFAWRDTRDAPLVAIVSEKMARVAWPGEDPLGKRVSTSGREGTWRTVVGVVGDVRYRDLLFDPIATPEDPDIYFPLSQAPTRDLGVILRASEARPGVFSVQPVRRELTALDAAIPIFGIRAMEEAVSEQLAMSRLLAALLLASGSVAAALSAMGIYGLLAQLVVDRRFEIGIRIALGADRHDVLRYVMARGLRLACGGLVVGLAGSLVFGRYIESLLFEVSATDALAYLSGGAVLLVVVVLASYLPARHAARLDPVHLLSGAQ